MKQFDHMIERKLNLELSNVFPRLKFLAGVASLVILVIIPWLSLKPGTENRGTERNGIEERNEKSRNL